MVDFYMHMFQHLRAFFGCSNPNIYCVLGIQALDHMGIQHIPYNDSKDRSLTDDSVCDRTLMVQCLWIFDMAYINHNHV